MAAIALALASCIAVGTTDFLAGLKSRQLGVLTVLAISQPAGLILLGIAIAFTGVGSVGPEFIAYTLVAGVTLLAAQLAFWQGLTVGAMGIVAPIAQTGAIIPIAAGLAEGERPTAVQLAGVVIILFGVILTTYEPGSVSDRDRETTAGIGLALAAAVAIGAWYLAIDGAAERATPLSAAFANRLVSVALLLAPVIILRKRISLRASDVPAVATIGFLEVTGIFMFAAAASLGLLSLTGGIAALYPLPTLLLARYLLDERLRAIQRVGSVVVVVGIVAVTAGAAT